MVRDIGRRLSATSSVRGHRTSLTYVNVKCKFTITKKEIPMAMTAAQRKQKQIERERAEMRVMPDGSYPFLKTPFHEWLPGTDWEAAEHDINAAGMNMPVLDDNSGPSSFDGEVEQGASNDWHPYAGYQGSIGRAESMVDYMLSALSQMTVAINAYKIEQIDARIGELERADLSSAEAKKQALSNIVRLTKMKEHLGRTVRVSLPQWKVKGI
jgi:hypothetical protein